MARLPRLARRERLIGAPGPPDGATTAGEAVWQRWHSATTDKNLKWEDTK